MVIKCCEIFGKIEKITIFNKFLQFFLHKLLLRMASLSNFYFILIFFSINYNKKFTQTTYGIDLLFLSLFHFHHYFSHFSRFCHWFDTNNQEVFPKKPHWEGSKQQTLVPNLCSSHMLWVLLLYIICIYEKKIKKRKVKMRVDQ